MAKRKTSTSTPPGYVVLRQVGERQWEMVGEARRKPGLTARAARAQAIRDAVGGEVAPADVYVAVLRSEWRVGLDY
jgi:hypothetical protein